MTRPLARIMSCFSRLFGGLKWFECFRCLFRMVKRGEGSLRVLTCRVAVRLPCMRLGLAPISRLIINICMPNRGSPPIAARARSCSRSLLPAYQLRAATSLCYCVTSGRESTATHYYLPFLLPSPPLPSHSLLLCLPVRLFVNLPASACPALFVPPHSLTHRPFDSLSPGDPLTDDDYDNITISRADVSLLDNQLCDIPASSPP